MDTAELNKIRGYYHSIFEQKRILDSITSTFVELMSFSPLETQLKQLNDEFPELLPPFNRDDYFMHIAANTGRPIYNLNGIRGYVAMTIGQLRALIEQPSGIPIIEKRHFLFVKDPELKTIIERDNSEVQKAVLVDCWKSVIILCGGIIEGILTDLLISNEAQAKAAKSAPKKADIREWDLSDLINVALERKLVTPGVDKLSHSVREYRNLVHPGKEIRDKLNFGAEEARIAIDVVNILHRELTL